MKVLIDSSETLEYAADFYHDVRFHTNQITFNEDEQSFSLKLIRVKWEETKTIMNLLFLKIGSAPRVESVLSFYQVTNMESRVHCERKRIHEIDLSEEESVDFINTIEYYPKKHKIEFKCVNGTIIQLTVGRINGKLQDTEEKLGTAIFFSLFGVEFSTD